VTCLEWSVDGCKLLSGDETGTVAVTDISAYSAAGAAGGRGGGGGGAATAGSGDGGGGVDGGGSGSGGGGDGDGRGGGEGKEHAPKQIQKYMTTSNILSLGSHVVQTGFSRHSLMAVLSTKDSVNLLSVPNGIHPKVGSKPREGLYGGCFHAHARAAVPVTPEEKAASTSASSAAASAPGPGGRAQPVDDEGAGGWRKELGGGGGGGGRGDSVGSESGSNGGGGGSGGNGGGDNSELSDNGSGGARRREHILAARPGRRLWVVEAWVDHDDVPVSRVLVTLRPAIPPPSAAPGAPRPPVRPTGAKPRKWEFGELHPMGPCVLAVSDRALAVVDVAGSASCIMLATSSTGFPTVELN